MQGTTIQNINSLFFLSITQHILVLLNLDILLSFGHVFLCLLLVG